MVGKLWSASYRRQAYPAVGQHVTAPGSLRAQQCALPQATSTAPVTPGMAVVPVLAAGPPREGGVPVAPPEKLSPKHLQIASAVQEESRGCQ